MRQADLEKFGGGAETRIEVERLAQTDDKLQMIARRELRIGNAGERFPGRFEVALFGGLPVSLEMRTGEDDLSGIGMRRLPMSLGREPYRLFVLLRIVGSARLGQRVGRY